MVEIEQAELESLREKAGKYDSLNEEHTKLTEKHNNLLNSHDKLKDDYIALCKGQRSGEQEKPVDDFDKICQEKFDKNKNK